MRNFCLKKNKLYICENLLCSPIILPTLALYPLKRKPTWRKNMKTTSEYIALLRKYMAENAHKYGIVRMGIFGSVARGEQTENSDVDVCVESSA